MLELLLYLAAVWALYWTWRIWYGQLNAPSLRAQNACPREPALDSRRFLLRALLIRFAVVLELELPSESLSLEELELDELDEFSISARTSGYGSSSIICCGVLSYMYACDFDWKR